MQARELAGFFRALGHRVIETESCFWYNPSPFLFRTLPVHRLVNPSAAEIAKVLMLGPTLALRYPKTADKRGSVGGMYVCFRRDYDIESLPPNARSHTRRGLARCRIEKVDFDYLAQHGHALTEQTTLRQTGKPPRRTQADWERFCAQASRTADVEGWAAFVGDQFAAFIVGMLVEDCYYIYLQKSATELLKFYPNNALMFTLMKLKLACPEVGHVSHGSKPIEASEGLHYFKRSMGFEMLPFAEHLVFNPLLKPVLSWKGDAVVNGLARRHPESLFWRRASKALRMARVQMVYASGTTEGV